MKNIILTGSFLVLPFFLFSQTLPDPPRLKRADSFFGVHFDFHAGPDCNEIGKNVDEAMIENIVSQVKPDFIQVDCKGHAGYSSYPTKAGNPAPGFVKDQLKMWRQVTAKNGIALYMHYSGVWDTRAIQFHPSWAAVNADGTLSENNTSVFGPYADSLLIPQLKELSNDYGVDGVWIDGDCWAHQVDYSFKARNLFTQKTGITGIPMQPGDADWREFLNFSRQGFRDYVTHYTNELHKFNPDFQVASNWAFSTLMPERVSTPVVREFLDALVREMQPALMTEVKGSHFVDVTLNKLGKATILNLVNAAGPHDNDKVLVFDEIPALGPLQISIRYPSKPERVMLQPENRALTFTYKKGMVQCTLPSLEIHEMVVIE